MRKSVYLRTRGRARHTLYPSTRGDRVLRPCSVVVISSGLDWDCVSIDNSLSLQFSRGDSERENSQVSRLRATMPTFTKRSQLNPLLVKDNVGVSKKYFVDFSLVKKRQDFVPARNRCYPGSDPLTAHPDVFFLKIVLFPKVLLRPPRPPFQVRLRRRFAGRGREGGDDDLGVAPEEHAQHGFEDRFQEAEPEGAE